MVDLDLTAAGGGEKDAHIDVTLFPNGMLLSLPVAFLHPIPPSNLQEKPCRHLDHDR